jgi:endonuclease V-like protein UPF0215 family
LIKKEARILGLAAASVRQEKISVVGIVFRGNLWVDGILTCQIEPEEPDWMTVLASTIVKSGHYSQIHAVILQNKFPERGTRFDISDFARKINLPVISIRGRTHVRKSAIHRNPEPKSRTDSFGIKGAGEILSVNVSGLGQEEACEIFTVACVEGQQIPEAVRIAKMVATKIAGRLLSKHASNV